MTLMAGEQAIRQEVRRTLDQFGDPRREDGHWGGHILNLGHGIQLNTPIEAVAAMVDEAKKYSQILRKPPQNRNLSPYFLE
jgi:uroporphyrinogen decarboxylase